MSAYPLRCGPRRLGFRLSALISTSSRSTSLSEGHSFVDDVSDARLQAALATGRYRGEQRSRRRARDFDIAVISVPTPLREGNPDLSYIEDAAASLAPHLRPGCCVILESTTYPGTTQELVQPILEQGSGLVAEQDFSLGYSPERIDPGNEVWTFETTPKVVSGVGPRSLAAVQGFYDQLVERTVPVSSPREAELTKLLENTFRHVNIALVNEMAMFANDLGIDVWETIDAASTKPFGFMRFTPGPGVGGHCLPIDPSYLSWRVQRSLGRSFRFVELANDVNDHMPDYVVRRIVVALNERGLAVQRAPHPAARARVQAQHRRCSRVSVDADRPPAPRTRRGGSRSRPTRRGARRRSPGRASQAVGGRDCGGRRRRGVGRP